MSKVPRNVKLPPRLYIARTVRIVTPCCLDVNIDLSFGVTLRKKVQLEAVPEEYAGRALWSKAVHAFVVLTGGKQLVIHADDLSFIHSDDVNVNGSIRGRVFLAESVYDSPVGMERPYGLDYELLDVSAYMLWLRDKGFDIGLVRTLLNGKR